MKRIAVSLIISVLGLPGIVVLSSNSGAANRGEALPRFEFTCETTETEFYDWIETAVWQGPTPSRTRFHRTLDGAISALVTNPRWQIRTTEKPCMTSSAMSRSRREALYFMIDDAHAEGAGNLDSDLLAKFAAFSN